MSDTINKYMYFLLCNMIFFILQIHITETLLSTIDTFNIRITEYLLLVTMFILIVVSIIVFFICIISVLCLYIYKHNKIFNIINYYHLLDNFIIISSTGTLICHVYIKAFL